MNRIVKLISIGFVLGALIVSFAFIRINKELQKTKTEVINIIKKRTGLKISMGSISPLFFKGIKLHNISVKDEKDKIILKTGSVIIKFRLVDILFKKIKPAESIYSVGIENFRLNLIEGENNKFAIEDIIRKIIKSNKGQKKLRVETVYGNGEIKITSLKNSIDLKEVEFEYEVDSQKLQIYSKSIIKKLYGFDFGILSFIMDGRGYVKEDGYNLNIILSDFIYNSNEIDKKINIVTLIKKDMITLKGKDSENGLKIDGLIDRKWSRLNFWFNEFNFINYKITGKIVAKHSYLWKGAIDVNVYNKKTKDNYLIYITKNGIRTKINNIIISQRKDKFTKLTGWYKDSNSFFIKIWFNNYKLNNYILYGKSVLYPSQNNIKKFKLINFYINDYKVKEIQGILTYNNDVLHIKTIKSSGGIYINTRLSKRKTAIDLKITRIYFDDIARIFELKNLDKDFKQGYIEGKINAEINQERNITSYLGNLTVVLKNNPYIKKIYYNATYKKKKGNFRVKIILKDNTIAIWKGNSRVKFKRLYFKSKLNVNNRKFDINGNLLEKRNGYDINLIALNFIKLQGYVSKKGYMDVRLVTDKWFKGNIISYLKSDLKIKVNINNLSKININGVIVVGGKNYKDSFYSKIVTKNNKILFKKARLYYKNVALKGSGFYNKTDGKLNINFRKFKINGNLSLNEIRITFIFNKLNHIKFLPKIQFGLNGIIVFRTDFDDRTIYANLNFYNILLDKYKLDEVYLVYKIKNNNIDVIKFNSELYGGKVKSSDVNIYRKNGRYYFTSIFKLYDIKLQDINLNGKIYTKMIYDNKLYGKIKILKLYLNNLKIKNVYEKFIYAKNKIVIKKLTESGIKGVVDLSKDKYDLKLFKDHEYVGMMNGYGINKPNWTHINFKKLDIDFLEDINDFITSADGSIDGDITIRYRKGIPHISGIVRGDDIEFKGKTIIRKVDNLHIDISANQDRLSINKLTGRIGGGRFLCYGTIDLKGFTLGEWNLRFKTLDEDGIYIEKRESDLMGNLKTELEITGTRDDLKVAGRAIIQNFDFTWPLESSGESGASSGAPFIKKIDLDVDLIAGKKVTFFQNQNNIDIKVKEGGKFHIKGDLSDDHKVVGQMEAEEGTLEYFGTPFKIDYAIVSFARAYEENVPLIRAKAEAVIKDSDGEDVTITMLVDGRAYNDLTPKLISIPALTQREIFYLLQDSSLYISSKNGGENIVQQSDKDIEEILKIGFIQIFDTTYRNKLISPLQRKVKRFLGLDILRIKSKIVENLLSPKIVNLKSGNSQEGNNHSIFLGTQVTVGKYLTDFLLLKYSVAIRERDDEFNSLYYEHQFGVEMNILKSLKFEWKYQPLYLYQGDNAVPQQEYILKWKKKISF